MSVYCKSHSKNDNSTKLKTIVRILVTSTLFWSIKISKLLLKVCGTLYTVVENRILKH